MEDSTAAAVAFQALLKIWRLARPLHTIISRTQDTIEDDDIALTDDMDPLYIEDLYQDHSWPSANGALLTFKSKTGGLTGNSRLIYSLGQ